METSPSHAVSKKIAQEVGHAMEVGDWITVLAQVSPTVVAHVPEVGELVGSDAVAGFLADTSAKTTNGEHFELLDTMVGDDHVALYFRITAERTGRAPLDNLTVHLARLDEAGLIAEIWFHNFNGPAVANFWK